MHAWKLVQRLNRRRSATALAAAGLVLSWTAAAEACPMCKAALGTNADHFIHAWGLSIVFMLSMPFLLISSFSLYMYYLVRRARAEQAAKEAAAMEAAGVNSVATTAPAPSRSGVRENSVASL